MTHRFLAPLCAALLLSAAPAAIAQTAVPPPASANEDAPGQAIPPSTDPCAAQPGADGGSLSGQLAECGGVLVPPETGTSGIEAPVPAPDPGTTPVIPPDAVPSPDGDGSANPT